jgi:MarR family transcriptional regulator, organic hydroperoxide resistance regulator
MFAQELATSISTLYFLLKYEYTEDLTHQTVRVLQFISMSDGQPRIDDVRRHMDLSPNTASEMVKRLATKGLVERRRSLSDERVVELALTEKGKRTLREQTEMDVSKLKQCIAQLDASQQAALEAALHALLESAKQFAEPVNKS